MAKISFSPKFIKEVIMLFRERPIKDIIFGKAVTLSVQEKKVLEWIKKNPDAFRAAGGRMGHFKKIDPVHKGNGSVYLSPNTLGDAEKESLIIFDEDVAITQGPDLWVCLSTHEDVKKDGLGDYIQLVLIKGNKGGQTYILEKPLAELTRFKSVVIWCKQFEVLFSFAPLS